jgi:hypothetical protein
MIGVLAYALIINKSSIIIDTNCALIMSCAVLTAQYLATWRREIIVELIARLALKAHLGGELGTAFCAIGQSTPVTHILTPAEIQLVFHELILANTLVAVPFPVLDTVPALCIKRQLVLAFVAMLSGAPCTLSLFIPGKVCFAEA